MHLPSLKCLVSFSTKLLVNIFSFIIVLYSLEDSLGVIIYALLQFIGESHALVVILCGIRYGTEKDMFIVQFEFLSVNLTLLELCRLMLMQFEQKNQVSIKHILGAVLLNL